MNPLLHLSVPFILASQSPRRRALLKQMQVEYRAEVSPAEETMPESASPSTTVETLSRRKARPVAKDQPEALVLAADTLVAHDGDILSKPNTPQHARRMLRRLSDTRHTVHTGIALRHENTDREVAEVASTHVTFARLSDDEIDAYVETGAPMDKAGGYGIQDHTAPFFIDHLDGDYYTVVGLPLRRLYLLVNQEFGELLAT